MKKYYVLLILVMICFVGCGKGDNKDAQSINEETEKFDYENFDWETYLRGEVFDTSTTVGDTMAQVVTIEVEKAGEDQIEVNVLAPDAYEPVHTWFDAVSDEEFSDSALEQCILDALAGETLEYTFTMTYDLVVDEPYINYPSEYLNAVSCGLITFYNELYESTINELGGTTNE